MAGSLTNHSDFGMLMTSHPNLSDQLSLGHLFSTSANMEPADVAVSSNCLMDIKKKLMKFHWGTHEVHTALALHNAQCVSTLKAHGKTVLFPQNRGLLWLRRKIS